MPNSAHNVSSLASWLSDELFQRHTLSAKPQSGLHSQIPGWVLSGALGITVAVGGVMAWRAISPAQCQRLWPPTNAPTQTDSEDLQPQ